MSDLIFGAPAPPPPHLGESRKTKVQSPYLNFDPAFVNPANQPEYILPEGSTGKRGSLEIAFQEIGIGVIGGYSLGLMGGVMHQGRIRDKTKSSAIWRTEMFNHATKRGSAFAQSAGSAVLLYSLASVGVSKFRGVTDEFSNLGGGFIAGCIFRLPAAYDLLQSGGGLRQMVRPIGVGGVVGTVAALVWSGGRLFALHRDRFDYYLRDFRSFFTRNTSRR